MHTENDCAIAELPVAAALDRYCSQWLPANNRSLKTITAYRADLGQLVSSMPPQTKLGELSRDHLEAWLAKLQGGGYMGSSIRRKLASVRGFLRYWEERGLVDFAGLRAMRARPVATRTLTRVVPAGEMSKLIAYLAREHARKGGRTGSFLRLRNRTIVHTLYATGMRVGELVSLTLDSVRLEQGEIRVLGKGRRERLSYVVGPLERELLEEYLRLRESLAAGHSLLFVNQKLDPLTTGGVRALLRRAGDASGVDLRITPHMLRHTAATHLLENGADLRVVQTFLGHSSIRSTERYTHVSEGHLRSVLTRCHPLSLSAADGA